MEEKLSREVSEPRKLSTGLSPGPMTLLGTKSSKDPIGLP